MEVGTLASKASKCTVIRNGRVFDMTVPLVVVTIEAKASPHKRSWHTELPLWINLPLSDEQAMVNQSDVHEVDPTYQDKTNPYYTFNVKHFLHVWVWYTNAPTGVPAVVAEPPVGPVIE